MTTRLALCAASLAIMLQLRGPAAPPLRGQGGQDAPPAGARHGGGFPATIQAALDAARPGDTVLVPPGIYHEHVVVRAPVVLRGSAGAVLDGGGKGVVLTIEAPAHVSGLTIRGSGRDLSREDAGVLVLEADDVVIEDLRLEDVLFGVYVKQSRRVAIRRNRIEGKPLPLGERGDGIRLWYCHGGEVVGNTLDRTRDLVIWFSSDFEVRDNVVSDSRYGVHYMYSDHNRFEGNEFRNNHVGAFIMYSSDIEFRRNLFLEAFGASGIGLGLKDADDIRAVENAFLGNAVGISLDNAPTSVGVTNSFRGNLIAHNDIGVSLLASVHSNTFEGNVFMGNLGPVSVIGGDALGNRWHGNFWSEYAGFDEDADGIGDTPYRHERLADALYARRPELRWLMMSPAAGALDVLARLFPLLEPQPVVIDSAPLLAVPAGRGAAGLAARSPEDAVGGGGSRAAWAGTLFVVGALAFGATALMGRRAWWT